MATGGIYRLLLLPQGRVQIFFAIFVLMGLPDLMAGVCDRLSCWLSAHQFERQSLFENSRRSRFVCW